MSHAALPPLRAGGSFAEEDAAVLAEVRQPLRDRLVAHLDGARA